MTEGERADIEAGRMAATSVEEDDILYADWLRGYMPSIAPTSLLGLTLRNAWDAGRLLGYRPCAGAAGRGEG